MGEFFVGGMDKPFLKSNRILLKKFYVKRFFKKNLRGVFEISFNKLVGSIN